MSSPLLPKAAAVCLVVLGLWSLPETALAGACEYPKKKMLGLDGFPVLTLRKTTDGSSKDEAKPASVGYEDPDSGGDEYLLLDAALRWEALECYFSDTRVIFVPAAEAHRSKFDANPVKKTSVKLETEIAWGLLRDRYHEDGHAFLPRIKAEYGETHDSIKRKNSAKSALLVFFESNLKNRPNGWTYWDCGITPGAGGEVAGSCPGRYRWWPTFGVEYYDNLPVERTGLPTIDSINTTVGVVRFGVEAWPLLYGRNTPAPASPLQFLAEYTYRPRLGGDALLQGDATLLTVGLTYWFDPAQAVGLGLEYEDGENPLRNFKDEERTTLSLRVKF